jgi:glycosyltransferase involved in cell wall biosynthesis
MVPLALKIANLLFREGRNDQYIMTFETGIASFIVSLIQTLSFRRTPKHVILQFIMREKKETWPSKLKYLFMKACFSSLHMAICSSRREVEYYEKVFDWDSGKAHFVPLHTDPKLLDQPLDGSGDFIFSGGRTYRDYDTLIKAVTGTSIPTVIVSSETYQPSMGLPPNLTLMRELPLDAFSRLIENCRVLVLPLEEKEISTGQSVLLQAMALGKAIIATETSGTVDYIEDGVDGILVPPHDPGMLRQAILELMKDDKSIARIGANAKKSAREKYLPQQYLERVSALLSPVESQSGAG